MIYLYQAVWPSCQTSPIAYAVFTLGARAQCLGTSLRWALMPITFFPSAHTRVRARGQCPSTKLRPCTRGLNWHWVLVPTPCAMVLWHFSHDFATVSMCLVYLTWAYLQIGYQLNENGTISCPCLRTCPNARAPNVNIAFY